MAAVRKGVEGRHDGYSPATRSRCSRSSRSSLQRRVSLRPRSAATQRARIRFIAGLPEIPCGRGAAAAPIRRKQRMLSFAPARLDPGQEASSSGPPAASRRSRLTLVNCCGVMRSRIVDTYRCLVMDLPTQAHLKTLRDLLTYRLAELRAEIHAAEEERRDSAGAATREVIDRKEEAMLRQLTEVDGAQDQ